MRIESLEHNGRFWLATVSIPTPPDGVTFQADKRFGSWQRVEATPDGEKRYDLMPQMAADLQRLVRREERRCPTST